MTVIVNADSIKKVRQRLEKSPHDAEIGEEVNKMLAVKQRMLTYNDYSPCCGVNRCDKTASLEEEIALLKSVLSALGENETGHAVELLKEYERIAGVKYR